MRAMSRPRSWGCAVAMRGVLAFCSLATALLLGLLGSQGCDDLKPGAPTDTSANAGLRLFLEVDYLPGFYDETIDYITQTWRQATLQGPQSQEDDCTFLFSDFDKDIDLSVIQGTELSWTTSLSRTCGSTRTTKTPTRKYNSYTTITLVQTRTRFRISSRTYTL